MDEQLGEGERSVIGYWCDNHRVDVAASAAEEQIAHVSDLLKFFRSVIAHIVQSDRARGLLDYMAFLLVPPGDSEDVIASGRLLEQYPFCFTAMVIHSQANESAQRQDGTVSALPVGAVH